MSPDIKPKIESQSKIMQLNGACHACSDICGEGGRISARALVCVINQIMWLHHGIASYSVWLVDIEVVCTHVLQHVCSFQHEHSVLLMDV